MAGKKSGFCPKSYFIFIFIYIYIYIYLNIYLNIYLVFT